MVLAHEQGPRVFSDDWVSDVYGRIDDGLVIAVLPAVLEPRWQGLDAGDFELALALAGQTIL